MSRLARPIATQLLRVLRCVKGPMSLLEYDCRRMSLCAVITPSAVNHTQRKLWGLVHCTRQLFNSREPFMPLLHHLTETVENHGDDRRESIPLPLLLRH